MTELRANRRLPTPQEAPPLWPWVAGIGLGLAAATAGLTCLQKYDQQRTDLSTALAQKEEELAHAVNENQRLRSRIAQLEIARTVVAKPDRSTLPPTNYAVTENGRVYRYAPSNAPELFSPGWLGQMQATTRQAQRNLNCDHHRQRATLEAQRSNNAVNPHVSAAHRDRMMESKRFITEYCN